MKRQLHSKHHMRNALSVLARNECKWQQPTGGPLLLNPAITELSFGGGRWLPDDSDEDEPAGMALHLHQGGSRTCWILLANHSHLCLGFGGAECALTALLDLATATGLVTLRLDGDASSADNESLIPREVCSPLR